MKFENFSSQDFINNDFFVSWVLRPDEEKNAYWEIFIGLHPEKYQEIMKAKSLVLAVKDAPQYLPNDSQISLMWKKIISETDIEEGKIILPNKSLIEKRIFTWLAAAMIVMIGSFFFFKEKVSQLATLPVYERLVKYENIKLLERTNNSDKLQKVFLPDGSFVMLGLGGSVSYPPKFGQIRKVFLKGNGFFEVKKNPQSPFIVYAGQVVTKVIGTSFWIKQFDNKDQVEVVVKTGCVAVSSVNSIKQAFSKLDPKFLLVANQRAVYSKSENSLTRMLVDNPSPISKIKIEEEYIYLDKPIVEIFEDLKVAYNIDLMYDKEAFKNCLINTRFTDETFYERLSILCKVVNAQYDVIETQIVIKGKGCK